MPRPSKWNSETELIRIPKKLIPFILRLCKALDSLDSLPLTQKWFIDRRLADLDRCLNLAGFVQNPGTLKARLQTGEVIEVQSYTISTYGQTFDLVNLKGADSRGCLHFAGDRVELFFVEGGEGDRPNV